MQDIANWIIAEKRIKFSCNMNSEETQRWIAHEAPLRLGCFLGVLLLMAIWELIAPRREDSPHRSKRWSANLSLSLLDAVVGRFVAPAGAVGVAWWAEARNWGLFHQLSGPTWIETLGAIVLLDLGIYWQHRMSHSIPMLWRFHRVHHSDLHLDVTSGVRFHPVEIVLSLGLKSLLIAAIGASPLAVFVFEVLLNATSMFNHSNVMIAGTLDKMLRSILVTPDFHRVHHSEVPKETDSNFGFNLACWDHLFGSYLDQPEAGHHGMKLGLGANQAPTELTFIRLIKQPWQADKE